MTVSKNDEIAQIILCAHLKYAVGDDEKDRIKPFTTFAYNKLEMKMRRAGVGPGIFMTENINSVSRMLSLTEKESEHVKQLFGRADKMGEEIDRLSALEIYITTRLQSNYPSRLKRVMGEKAPVVFYFSGDTGILNKKTAAIVGSRKATKQECAYAANHAAQCAQKDVAVVSGGAAGIDSVAQQSALMWGGNVVVFVSDSMTRYVLRHSQHILQGKMLVFSACHPDMFFRSYNALERNKYIYASSDYALVVASADGKGGSFHGAQKCIQNNYTKLYVKNDSYATEGNKRLIALGGLPLG